MTYRLFVDKKLTPMERKRYITSLIGEYGKLGVINKFNNSIGFKAVSFDPVERTFPSNELYPDGYKSPSTAILEALRVVSDENTIVYIEFDGGYVSHPQKKYSYGVCDLFDKFFRFVKKVYPDVKIEKVGKQEKNLLSVVFNHFYLCMAEGDFITAEISSSRLLDEKELEYLKKNLRVITKEKIDINQFYCETCAKYDKTHPYHIEIEYI